MTTRMLVVNVGPGDIGVSPAHPNDGLAGTKGLSVLLRAGTQREFHVQAGQSLILNEVEKE